MKTRISVNLLTLFFAVLLFMGSAGFYFFSAVQVIAHRVERSENESTVELTLSKQEFKNIAWIGETDFVYNGVVFDMNSVRANGDHYIVNCEQDVTEGTILSAVKKHTTSDQNPCTSLNSDQLVLYSNIDSESIIPMCEAQITELQLPSVNDMTMTSAVQMSSPPPEV